jgi:hypothetical protein
MKCVVVFLSYTNSWDAICGDSRLGVECLKRGSFDPHLARQKRGNLVDRLTLHIRGALHIPD